MGWFSRLMGTEGPEVAPIDAKGVTFAPEMVRTIQGGAWTASSYGSMYRSQPAVRAVVDFLGRNIAQLNPKVYERVGDTDRLEVGDHPLARLLRQPSPRTTRYRHTRDTVSDLAIYDRAAWAKIRTGRRPVALERIPPMYLTAQVLDGRLLWVDSRNRNAYVRDDLVLFHGYSPEGDDLGVSPLETLRRVLAEEYASQQNRENMWRNSARQSGWIERPQDAPAWSDEARQRFRAGIEAVMAGGQNAGRIGILEEGMSWNGNSFSPKDTDYIEGRKLTYEEVCIEYGMKPSLLGMGGDTASSSESNHRHAYQDVFGPWLRMMQDEIELQLLPEFEPLNRFSSVYVEYNLAEKLKGSFEEQSKSIVSSVGVPYMSINEGRARLNLPRVDAEWADAPVQPLNVMYGGQASVVVPTADPSTASAPMPKMKAVSIDEDERADAAAEHVALLKAYFERLERGVASKTKSRDRWDDELRGDLFTLAQATTTSVGQLTAGQLRGRYDRSRVTAWLAENADRTAKSVNDHTFDAVAAAENAEAVRNVFEIAKTSGAETLGFSLATTLVNFATVEAAKHSNDDGSRRKTWIVTSRKSRHPEMNGESVGVDETFSNGARWPGDPSLGADGAAGCSCRMEIE